MKNRLEFITQLNDKELEELIVFCMMQNDRRQKMPIPNDENHNWLDYNLNQNICVYQSVSIEINKEVKDKRLGKCIAVQLNSNEENDGYKDHRTYLINDLGIRKIYGGYNNVSDIDLQRYLSIKFGSDYIKHLHELMLNIVNNTILGHVKYCGSSNFDYFPEALKRVEKAAEDVNVLKKTNTSN